MAVLRTKRETKVVHLLSDETAEVKLYTKQIYADYLAIQKASMGNMKLTGKEQEDGMQADLAAFMTATLTRMIVEWNLTDEDLNPLPVTAENINLLDKDDALFLFGEAQTDSGLPQDKESVGLDTNS